MAEDQPQWSSNPAVDEIDDTPSYKPVDFHDELNEATLERSSKKAREERKYDMPLIRKPWSALKFLEYDRACVEKYMLLIGEDRNWLDATDWFKATDCKPQEEIKQRGAIIDECNKTHKFPLDTFKFDKTRLASNETDFDLQLSDILVSYLINCEDP